MIQRYYASNPEIDHLGAYVLHADHRAAVRELVEALRDLLAMCERQADFNDDGDGRMLDRARAAIAKHQEGQE